MAIRYKGKGRNHCVSVTVKGVATVAPSHSEGGAILLPTS